MLNRRILKSILLISVAQFLWACGPSGSQNFSEDGSLANLKSSVNTLSVMNSELPPATLGQGGAVQTEVFAPGEPPPQSFQVESVIGQPLLEQESSSSGVGTQTGYNHLQSDFSSRQ